MVDDFTWIMNATNLSKTVRFSGTLPVRCIISACPGTTGETELEKWKRRAWTAFQREYNNIVATYNRTLTMTVIGLTYIVFTILPTIIWFYCYMIANDYFDRFFIYNFLKNSIFAFVILTICFNFPIVFKYDIVIYNFIIINMAAVVTSSYAKYNKFIYVTCNIPGKKKRKR